MVWASGVALSGAKAVKDLALDLRNVDASIGRRLFDRAKARLGRVAVLVEEVTGGGGGRGGDRDDESEGAEGGAECMADTHGRTPLDVWQPNRKPTVRLGHDRAPPPARSTTRAHGGAAGSARGAKKFAGRKRPARLPQRAGASGPSRDPVRPATRGQRRANSVGLEAAWCLTRPRANGERTGRAVKAWRPGPCILSGLPHESGDTRWLSADCREARPRSMECAVVT